MRFVGSARRCFYSVSFSLMICLVVRRDGYRLCESCVNSLPCDLFSKQRIWKFGLIRLGNRKLGEIQFWEDLIDIEGFIFGMEFVCKLACQSFCCVIRQFHVLQTGEGINRSASPMD